MTSISIDFPHGETRLLVERDGEARLFYGALPSYEIVQKETFDIDDLYEHLQTRIHKVVPAENRPPGEPYGMVNFGYGDGSTANFLIFDSVYTAELFQTARANIEKTAP